MAKRDLYEETTARILEQLEKGVIPWRKPWTGGSADMPINITTGKAYKGSNVVMLWVTGSAYRHQKWLTYEQAKAAGGHVKKGEKGTGLIKWVVKDPDPETGKRPMFPKAFTVFNIDQCEDLPFTVEEAAPINADLRDAMADEFLLSTGATIKHNEQRAYYTTAGDYINLPAYETFTGVAEYYSTAFHELTHWTGNEKRMNRTFGKQFGDCLYAAEELVAELGSAFLCAEFGFDNTTLENSAAYIASWHKVLKNNPALFTKAAGDAYKAASYLRGLTLAAPVAIAA